MTSLLQQLVSAGTLAVPGLALQAQVSAQTFTYEVDAMTSTIGLDGEVELDLGGDLRGVFDAMSNPGGTRTINGLFGDNGLNNLIPVDLGLGLDLDLGGALDGDFALRFDRNTLAVTVEDFDATFGTQGSSSLDLSVTLEFGTFRTVAPQALYLGGFPVTLPLGAADVSDLALSQPAPAVGLATATAQPGVFEVSLLLPVELSFTVTSGLFGGGAPTPVGPIPLVLPFSSLVFDLSDCESPLRGSLSEAVTETITLPTPVAFTDLPLDLPTILPPGGTANLLLDAELSEITLDGNVSVLLAATATDGRFEEVCAGVSNSTGLGAQMEAVGTSSVMAADLGLRVTQLPLDVFGMVIMSDTDGFVPGFGGSQGDLCLGSPQIRLLDSVQSSGAMGELTYFPDFANLPGGAVFMPGDDWVFQLWYRDVNPSVTSNTSSALRVTFCR